MKTFILFTGLLLLSNSLRAQTLEFSLSKGFTVGCNGANAMTDLTKKVKVTLKADQATVSFTSINCTKTIDCANWGVINEKTQAVLYFSEEEKKGCIIEKNEKILVVSDNKGKYELVAVGHIDKKQAKMLTVEGENPVFQPILGDMNNVLAKAKEQKKAAEMAKKMAKVPTTEFTDEYGISGIYYLSRTVQDEKHDKYVTEVNFQFEVEKGNLKIHFNEGLYDEAYIEQIYLKPLKEKSLPYIYFKGNNMTSISAFEDHVILPLEKDVYFVSSRNYSSDTRLDCSSVKIIENKDANGQPIRDYLILGKDKKRVEELMKDHALVEKLYIASCIEECNTYNTVRSGRNPMPAQGMKDAKLSAEAFGFIKTEAGKRNWPQTMTYCYLKNNDWVITRHKVTGAPLYRSMIFVTVMTSNGKCQWEESFLKQDYDGTTYGKSYFGGNTGNIVPVDCTDAMKYK